MTTLPVLLDRLTGHGRPRLTWYAADERVELSGHVLANWVTKTAHLLADELDVGPGSQVLVDLPAHWRSLVWSLATLRLGGELVGPAAAATSVVVTDAPRRRPDAAELVVVALPALARSAGPVPPGALDANAMVTGYPDAPGPWPAADPDRAALPGVSHAAILPWAARTVTVPAGARVLAAGSDPLDLLAVTLAALAGDGSVVLGDSAWAAGLLADPAARERLRAAERIDVDLLPDDPEPRY